jgi:hypothetical protein
MDMKEGFFLKEKTKANTITVCLLAGECRIARGRAHNATCGKEFPLFLRKKSSRRRPVVPKTLPNYQCMFLFVCQLTEMGGKVGDKNVTEILLHANASP